MRASLAWAGGGLESGRQVGRRGRCRERVEPSPHHGVPLAGDSGDTAGSARDADRRTAGRPPAARRMVRMCKSLGQLGTGGGRFEPRGLFRSLSNTKYDFCELLVALLASLLQTLRRRRLLPHPRFLACIRDCGDCVRVRRHPPPRLPPAVHGRGWILGPRTPQCQASSFEPFRLLLISGRPPTRLTLPR